jgi:hypothetical protein
MMNTAINLSADRTPDNWTSPSLGRIPQSSSSTLDSSNLQTITFGVLGIMLAVGSLGVGYLQLKRMRNQMREQGINVDVEVGDITRYEIEPLVDVGVWIQDIGILHCYRPFLDVKKWHLHHFTFAHDIY